jgi:hypothetical protein
MRTPAAAELLEPRLGGAVDQRADFLGRDGEDGVLKSRLVLVPLLKLRSGSNVNTVPTSTHVPSPQTRRVQRGERGAGRGAMRGAGRGAVAPQRVRTSLMRCSSSRCLRSASSARLATSCSGWCSRITARGARSRRQHTTVTSCLIGRRTGARTRQDVRVEFGVLACVVERVLAGLLATPAVTDRAGP